MNIKKTKDNNIKKTKDNAIAAAFKNMLATTEKDIKLQENYKANLATEYERMVSEDLAKASNFCPETLAKQLVDCETSLDKLTMQQHAAVNAFEYWKQIASYSEN